MLFQRAAWRIGSSLLGVALSGCSIVPGLHVSVSDSAPTYDLVEISPETLRTSASFASEATALPAADPTKPAEEYTIGPGDILTIVVWDHPELTNPTGEFRDAAGSGRLVAADGTVFYPHVGTFKAQGLTVGEVRDYLASSLSRIINKPQVDVRVAGFRAQRIQVTGEVRQPGLITLDDTSKGLLEAISERGGLSDRASRRQVTLIRRGRTYPINLSGLLSGTAPAPNPRLEQGDIIHVPDQSADLVFVLGEVGKPAPVAMQQAQMSLTEAITTAGGLDRLTADGSGVLVFRQGAEGARSRPTVYTLDLARPEGILLATQFELRPRDVVYVQATDFARYNLVINQLLPTITALFQLDLLLDRAR